MNWKLLVPVAPAIALLVYDPVVLFVALIVVGLLWLLDPEELHCYPPNE